MKTEKRITAFALSIIMLLGIMILSAGAAAPEVPSADITYDSDNEWENTLVINENITVKISGVTHENSDTAASAIKICDGAVVNLVFEGENILSGNPNKISAGIEVEEGSTVNIYVLDGSSLTVTGGKNSAGIGGIGYSSVSATNPKAGNVNIYCGKINAIGGEKGAGIGSGFHSSAGDINIYGGDVTATGTGSGAGIGSGYGTSGGAAVAAGVGFYNGGNITISGGTVRATASGVDFDAFDILDSSTYPEVNTFAAGIGGGYGASSGNIIIEGDADVTAIGSCGGAGIGTGRGTSKEANYDAEKFDCNVIIRGNAKVTALATADLRESVVGDDGGAAIGLGRGCTLEDQPKGAVKICENAQVTAFAANQANAIGSSTCVGKYTKDENGEIIRPAAAEMESVEINKPAVVHAYSDGTRTAVYEEATNITVAFLNEDGTELQSREYANREVPEYNGDPLTKDDDDWFTYEFAGWNPEIVPVEEEATYTAVYNATPIEYTAAFVDENGKTVGEITYDVNTKKITPPAVPEKEDFHAKWEDYKLTPGGITVKPVYTEFEPAVAIDDYEENTTIGYKENMLFRATAVDIPKDGSIHWFVNGEDAGTGEGLGVEEPTENYTVQAKIIDKDGNVRAESGVMNVEVKSTFFDRLIAFFTDLIDKILSGAIGEIFSSIC